ncbi:1-(5-phosphoribosyl)-5-((5-phosphoribosylamino)methylideneamino)imidazole-4-carboxamide isomerase [bacterium endosymbiont of Escarpia laminata]|nr:MAG: 1-(5-phosphoribosyl)-5-((5-phosphoribosylamino)methylideneamino)imidazole-4-carboxamide isomerase [bacterium endosymbiont of Escarpia laminata]
MEKKPRPVDIKVHQQSRFLDIAFDDGAHFSLPCEYLRVYSPSAETRGHTPAQAKLETGKERVSITDIKPVGSYAVKIIFDDGHDTGLYDWKYLYNLGKFHHELWQAYLEKLAAIGYTREDPELPEREN